jgi:hypothetical protein
LAPLGYTDTRGKKYKLRRHFLDIKVVAFLHPSVPLHCKKC